MRRDLVPSRTPLSDLGVLSQQQIDVLRALRITSAEALVDRIDHEYGLEVFGPQLGLTPAQFGAVRGAALDTTLHFRGGAGDAAPAAGRRSAQA